MPNFLVDAPGRDFPEDAWVGRVLRIGGLRMRVDQRDQCCVMVTIDPVTLRRDPAILRHSPGSATTGSGSTARSCSLGQVAVGDPVELEP